MPYMNLKTTLFSLAMLLLGSSVLAWYPRVAEDRIFEDGATSTIIGTNRFYQVAEGETLIQLARAFGLGFMNVSHANPGVDPWLPPAGKQITLPYATILPQNLKTGITINLADYKLYFVEEKKVGRSVRIYPVGIGVEGWETPLGQFRVLSKSPRPTWHVPASIRQQDPSLPRLVPPGPDNPLGEFWMAFSKEQHGIHGTNEPYGVGRRVSHGCIRLYPEDIKDLYRRTRVGTPVEVIYQPVKVADVNGQLYLEVHPDYLGTAPTPEETLRQYCQTYSCNQTLDKEQVSFAANKTLGYPLSVSKTQGLALRQP